MGIAGIVILVLIALNAFVGFKRGAIKGTFHLIGLIAISIIAFEIKDFLSDFLIQKLPFFNFPGNLTGILSYNILMYKALSFFVIFILLYCLLNILLNLSGFIDVLSNMNLVMELPSKIIGVIIGILEGIAFSFVLSYFFLQIGITQKYIMESNVARTLVERTPIVNVIFAKSTVVAEKSYESVKTLDEGKDINEVNLEVIRHIIQYRILNSSIVQECIDNKKLGLENVVVSS